MDTEQILSPLLKVEYPNVFIEETIPVFASKTDEEKVRDKYENSTDNVNYYTAGIAYGSQLLNLGGAESLYATINYLVLKHFDKNKSYKFLDLACGAGRTMHDLAGLFPESLFVGLDYSYQMVRRSKQILLNKELLELDLQDQGFGKLSLQGKNYDNVILAQGDACNLPFRDNSFDCVCNTYLIDRVKDPEEAIRKSIEVLKPGGLFVFTDPLNFDSKENWEKKLTPEKIISIVEECGIEIINWHDGLIFKQQFDRRDNNFHYSTLVIHGVKR